MQKGFTVIEIIVSISIFAVIIFTASNLFVSMIRDQREVLQEQDLLSQGSYVMEYISRSLRMAKTQTPLDVRCLSSDGLTYERSGNAIRFINHTAGDICQEFNYDDNLKMIFESKNADSAGPIYTLLLAGNVYSDGIGITIIFGKTDSMDPEKKYQSRIRMGLWLFYGDDTRDTKKIQTTISQRELNIEY